MASAVGSPPPPRGGHPVRKGSPLWRPAQGEQVSRRRLLRQEVPTRAAPPSCSSGWSGRSVWYVCHCVRRPWPVLKSTRKEALVCMRGFLRGGSWAKGFSSVGPPMHGRSAQDHKRLRLRCKGLCEAQPQNSSPCGFAQKTQAADCDGLLSPRGRPGADRGGVGVLGVGAVCGLCLYM